MLENKKYVLFDNDDDIVYVDAGGVVYVDADD